MHILQVLFIHYHILYLLYIALIMYILKGIKIVII